MKAVNLSQLIGQEWHLRSDLLQGGQEDKRNTAKAIHPLYYGAYSSHDLKQETEFHLHQPDQARDWPLTSDLVYSAFGDEVKTDTDKQQYINGEDQVRMKMRVIDGANIKDSDDWWEWRTLILIVRIPA